MARKRLNGFLPKSPISSYDVGYCKPPAAHKFKTGQSGNPGGRPKGARSKRPWFEGRLREIVLEQADRQVKINKGNRQISVPMADAIVRAIAINAAKGNHRSQKLFTDLQSAAEAAKYKELLECLQNAINYKSFWEYEIERCKKLGIRLPDPLPHPDHVIIDYATGEVTIKGQMDLKTRDTLRQGLAYLDKLIEDIEGLLEIPRLKLKSLEEVRRTLRFKYARYLRVHHAVAKALGRDSKNIPDVGSLLESRRH